MKNFLKEKIKNKFIIIILVLIAVIIGYQWYKTVSLFGVDTDSYAVLVEWEWSHNSEFLGLNEPQLLSINDEVQTLWEHSIIVIEWWDGSITRLWGDSKVVIEELDVSQDLSRINLSFSLSSGKTWSNVVSFLWEDSYFKQNFEDVQASVRGTIFDVDLTNNYVFVEDHEVALTKWDSSIILKENSAFNIRTFSFIELQKFLEEVRDTTWKRINQKLDSDYFTTLRKNVSENFSQEKIASDISKKIGSSARDLEALEKTISTFSDEKKQEAYTAILEQYQKLNFINSDDWELFEQKNTLKKLLISSSNEENKKNLVKYSLYDLKDALDTNNFVWVKNVLELIGENKDILPDLDSDILKDIQLLPDSLKEVFSDQMDVLEKLVSKEVFSKILTDISLDSVGTKAKTLLNSSTDSAAKWFDAAKNTIEWFIQKIK